MRYPFIYEQSRQYTVSLLCQVMQVDRRGYYRWIALQGNPAVSDFSAKRKQDIALVKQAFAAEKGKVGSRSIVSTLQSNGHRIGRYRVRRIMQEQGLQCRIRRAYRPGRRTANHQLIFAKQPIVPACTNALWVTDITYIKTREGWRYLSVILDAYSRRVIGHMLGNHMTTNLVIRTLKQAIVQRKRESADTVIHSDQGSQYSSYAWHNTLEQCGLSGSMSYKGSCYDNAVMERFFGTLKDALIVDEPLVDAQTMEANIEQWIVKYNYQRGHSALGWLSPAQFEREQLRKVA